jgi:hypothetical protein
MKQKPRAMAKLECEDALARMMDWPFRNDDKYEAMTDKQKDETCIQLARLADQMLRSIGSDGRYER